MNPVSSRSPGFPSNFELKERKYKHFDWPLTGQKAVDVLSTISDPNIIARHSFYPFISKSIETKRYKAKMKRVLIKKRRIAYAAHLDAAIYQYYSGLISELYEASLICENLTDVPVAYRRFFPSKSNLDIANEAFTLISQLRPCVAMAFDVAGFFDNIDHSLLRTEWLNLLGCIRLPNDHQTVMKSITRFSVVPKGAIERLFEGAPQQTVRERSGRVCTTEEFQAKIRQGRRIHVNNNKFGIPQGSPMSGVLSNVYMLPFDKALKSYAEGLGGVVRRYSDDILLVLPINLDSNNATDSLIDQAKAFIKAAIEERKLQIQMEKTELTACDAVSGIFASKKIVQYLGLTFDGQNKRIRSQTLSRYYGRLSRCIKRAKYASLTSQGHTKIRTKTLNQKYSHLGFRNFISYAYRAAEECDSKQIRSQVARHPKVIKAMIDKKLVRKSLKR